MIVDTPPTLPAALAVLSTCEDAGLSVYDRRGKKALKRTYAEFTRRTLGRAAWLREQGLEPGQIAYLCVPTSHELLETFLAASLLGALPCVLGLPRAVGGLSVFQRRLQRLEEAFGGILITSEAVGAESGRSFWALPAEPPAEGLDPSEAFAPVDRESLAYVQLTSGSTTAPKAVAITQRNLSANTKAIYLSCIGLEDSDEEDVSVSWLPLYHDMGLVGMALTAFFHRYDLVLLQPQTFVGNPLRWLQVIAEQTKSVITTGPNFAYQWCLDRIKPEKLEGLDLTPLRVAGCGAEMIRPETLSGFCERMGPYGFYKHAFVPCYGMAEATLAVTFSPPGQDIRIAMEAGAEGREASGRVSCGKAVVGLEFTIQDPESGEEVEEGVVGEICARGDSIFPGYYQNEAATARVLRGGWFHTGDLGFQREGELFVTGRLKDLIILDGHNVAPYEIEWIAEQHFDMGGGRAAAFSVSPEGREIPVLVVEAREVPDAALLDTVVKQVGQDVATLYDLVLVRRGSLPKTSSGKVKRGKIREDYLAGALQVLWSRRASAE